jgi:hypothetical protein
MGEISKSQLADRIREHFTILFCTYTFFSARTPTYLDITHLNTTSDLDLYRGYELLYTSSLTGSFKAQLL